MFLANTSRTDLSVTSLTQNLPSTSTLSKKAKLFVKSSPSGVTSAPKKYVTPL